MIDKINLPFRDPSDEFRLEQVYDDLAESVSDPTERRVMQAIAGEIYIEHQPETIQSALDLIERATPQARIALLNRGRKEAGLQALEVERMEVQQSTRTTSGPRRDHRGWSEAWCSEPDCGEHLVGELPGQVVFAPVRRFWCEKHLIGPDREADMAGPYEPRFAYSPSGAIVNLDDQEAEVSRAAAEVESLRRIREAKLAEAAADVAALEPFEQQKREADRKLNRQQFPLEWTEGAA